MESMLFVLVLMLTGHALCKLFSSLGKARAADKRSRVNAAVQLELRALNRELRAFLAGMGYHSGVHETDRKLEQLESSRNSDRDVRECEESFPSDDTAFWEEDTSVGSAWDPDLTIQASRSWLFDEAPSAGTMINPATGLAMLTGDTCGVDIGGNMYGSSALSDSIDSNAFVDNIDSIEFPDSIGSSDPFGSAFSDPFSIH